MRRLVVLCAALLVLAGCAQQSAEPRSATVFAMDTVMELTVYGGQGLPGEAEELIMELESRLSVTDDSSEIAVLNRRGSGSVSGDTQALLDQALSLCQWTDGALDISVYPVVRAWGFTTGEYHVPKAEELSELLAAVDYRKIALEAGTVTLAPGMQIDLGSVAKGWVGDQVLERFRERGVRSAILNLGGNVQTLGAKPDGSPWRVGVKDPAGEGYVGSVKIVGKAAITSGGYQRYFEQEGKVYHHIIDPDTGCPADNGLLSVTVIGESGVVCDGLSTALFVMGLDEAVEFWTASGDFDAIFITGEGIAVTEGIAEDFEPLGSYRSVEVLYRDKD